MSNLLELIKALFPGLQHQSARDEAYLAEATDAHDLERRMRRLEYTARHA